MSHLLSSFRSFSLSLILLLVATVTSPAAASDDPTRPGKTTESYIDATRVAYVMAWRNSQEAVQHTDAVRLVETLATQIGLSADAAAYNSLERFLDNELAVNPGRFTATDEPQKVLAQLLREDVGGFQRALSPILPDDCYERYQELLDELHITVR